MPISTTTSTGGGSSNGIDSLATLYDIINGKTTDVNKTETATTTNNLTKQTIGSETTFADQLIGGVTVTDSDRTNQIGARTDSITNRTNVDSGRTDTSSGRTDVQEVRRDDSTYSDTSSSGKKTFVGAHSVYDSGNTVDTTSRVVNSRNLDSVVEHTGRTDTQVTDSGISQEGMNAMLRDILSGNSAGTQGLSAVSSGQRLAGGYGSSINTLLTNDLLARSASQVAQQQRHAVTTTNIGGNKDITTGRDTTVTDASNRTVTGASSKSFSDMVTEEGPSSSSTRSGTTSVTTNTNRIGAESKTIGGSTQTLGGYTQTTGDQTNVLGGGTKTTSDQQNTSYSGKGVNTKTTDTGTATTATNTTQNTQTGGVDANGLLKLGGTVGLGALLSNSGGLLTTLSNIISGVGNTGGVTNGGNGGVDLHTGGNTGGATEETAGDVSDTVNTQDPDNAAPGYDDTETTIDIGDDMETIEPIEEDDTVDDNYDAYDYQN